MNWLIFILLVFLFVLVPILTGMSISFGMGVRHPE